MFDRIGARTDGEARRREAQSAVLTSLLITVVAGFWVGFTAWRVATPEPAPVDPPVMAMLIDVVDTRVDDPLPAAPPPAARKAPDPSPPAPQPDPSAEPRPLSPVVPQPLVSSPGTPDGEPDGDPTSSNTGLKGTGTDPRGTGEGPGGRHEVVHVTQLSWKSPVAPAWPEAATVLGVKQGECFVEVWYDRRGVPESVTFQACPEVFQRSARSAILRSRVEPFQNEGNVTAIQTTLKIRYVLKE